MGEQLHDIEIRDDLLVSITESLKATARSGGSLDGPERVEVATAARTGTGVSPLHKFARHLYAEPATITEADVREPADQHGDPRTVEVIGIVSRLASVDRLHEVLGLSLPPLPPPKHGPATGKIAAGLKRRRGHVPMPPGAIPSALDLIPSEAAAFQAMFGPFYMTEVEMGDPYFSRPEGLNTPQLETVAARISLVNRCFY